MIYCDQWLCQNIIANLNDFNNAYANPYSVRAEQLKPSKSVIHLNSLMIAVSV